MKHHTSRTPGPRRPLCCVFPAFCPRRKWYFILAKYLCVTLPGFKGFIDSRLRLSKFIKPECLSTVGKAWCRSGSAVKVVTLSRRRRQSPLRLPATITRLIVRRNGAECMHNIYYVLCLTVIPSHCVNIWCTFCPSNCDTGIDQTHFHHSLEYPHLDENIPNMFPVIYSIICMLGDVFTAPLLPER